MNRAGPSRGSQPGGSTVSTDESVGQLTPPSSASTSDEASDGEGGGGYADFGDDSHNGLKNLSIPPLDFPGMIDIPGLELSHIDPDVSPGPCRSPAPPASPVSPVATAENDDSISAPRARPPSEPHASTPPSEGCNQRLGPDDSDADQSTENYTVFPTDGKDEARAAAAFLRILSLVPLRNVVNVHEVKGLTVWWNVLLTKDQALELLADPSVGAVLVPGGDYDPTDC